MATIDAAAAGGQNAVAWLDMLAWSEIGPQMLADPRSSEGYRVIVGSMPGKTITFEDYARHPRVLVQLGSLGIYSSAAGRYQFIWPTWYPLAKQLNLPDFSPESQDQAALELTRQCGAYALVVGGNLTAAMAKASVIWASLPGSPYGQGGHSVETLTQVYQSKGGTVS